jgi:hypothetical protein
MSVDILARKKLIHAMPLNTDQAINRGMVVGCAISATRNYLKLHMPRTLNPLLCNNHTETQKLWKRSAMRIAASRPDAVHRSLMHSASPPKCHVLSWATCTLPRISGARATEVGASIKSS